MSLRLANDFLVGCDPEFVVLTEDGKLQECHIDYEDEALGSVGIDHGGDVVELRPVPARGSYTVVNRMKRLLCAEPVRAELKGKWRAGAAPMVITGGDGGACTNPDCDCNAIDEDVQPLGGHIHLGIKPDNPKWYEIGKALDAHTRLLEHLDILPAKESETRRGHGEGYGKYGVIVVNGIEDGGRMSKEQYDDDYSPEFGDDPDAHMEYRTPPSWLFHPKVAMLCLTGSKLAAVDPEGTIEKLDGATHLNSLRNWYDGFKGKDINADRVSERILHGARIEQLRFDPDGDIRERWSKLGF